MTTFLRLLHEDDKATSLEKALAGERGDLLFEVDPDAFAKVPGSPFAYWVNPVIRLLFDKFLPLQSGEVRLGKGPDSGDDFRFLRLWWEVCVFSETTSNWVDHPKGGEFSRFYSDPHLVIDWRENGTLVGMHGNLRNPSMLRRAGLTWSRRTTSALSVRVLPRNCIFGDKGPALVLKNGNEDALFVDLAIMNSRVFAELVLQLNFSLDSVSSGTIVIESGHSLVSATPYRPDPCGFNC